MKKITNKFIYDGNVNSQPALYKYSGREVLNFYLKGIGITAVISDIELMEQLKDLNKGDEITIKGFISKKQSYGKYTNDLQMNVEEIISVNNLEQKEVKEEEPKGIEI